MRLSKAWPGSLSWQAMRTILLVRHGQSQANAGGVTTAHHAIPLTRIGHAQAHALADRLPQQAAAILASPYERAQDTARPYSQKLGLPVHTMDALHELDAIALECITGMTGVQRGEVAAAYWTAADPHLRTGAGAETFTEFAQRVQVFRLQTLPQLADGSVLFGHGMWIEMLFWQLLGFVADDRAGMQGFRAFQQGWPMPNGAVYRIEQAQGSARWSIEADVPTLRHMRAIAEAEADYS